MQFSGQRDGAAVENHWTTTLSV